MRAAYQKNQSSRASSYFTPQANRKASSQRNHFSMVSHNHSIDKKMQIVKKGYTLPLKGEQNPEIYFDKSKRKTFIKCLIDGYFKQPKSIQPFDQSISNGSLLLQTSSIVRKNAYSSDGVRRNARQRRFETKDLIKNRVMELNISSLRDFDRLPTINESEFQQRPISEYQPRRKPQKRPSSPFSPFIGSNPSDLGDNFVVESSKNLYDSKIELHEKDEFIASKIQSKILKKKTRIFSTLDDEQLIRQKLANKLGLPVMWKAVKQTTLEYPLLKKNLRQMCYNIVQEKRGEEPIFLIFPTQYYSNLFANKCEQIFDIIKAMCKLIVKGNERVSNNQICMNNIYKIQEKIFVPYDWGCAGMAELLQVQGIKYPKFHQPYTRKSDQWLLSPEYLAPQLLRAIQYDSFEHLWGQKGGISSCDVWSIGCLLFQLITLIPLNNPHHCLVKGKQYSRRGLMGNKIRTMQNIMAKQKYLRSLVVRRVKEYLKQANAPIIDVKLLHILPKMLEQNPAKRITAAQVISILS